MLDAGGMCCESGALDECGVCDGNGESCTTQLTLLLDPDIKNIESCLSKFLPDVMRTPVPKVRQLVTDKCGQDVQLELRFKTKRKKDGRLVEVKISGGAVHTLSFRKDLERSISKKNPCGIRRVASFSKGPTCGNGICEVGEAKGLGHRHICADDCPFAFTTCPSRGTDGLVGTAGMLCSGNGIAVEFRIWDSCLWS